MHGGRFVRISVLVLSVLIGGFTSPPTSAQIVDQPYVPAEVIIKFKANAPRDEIDGVLAELGATRVKTFRRIGASLERIDKLDVPEAIARFADHPHIAYIEPNYLWSTDIIPNDPSFDLLWGMHNTGQSGGTPDADIDAPEAWDEFTGTDAVIVGVIDTGVDYNHVDLAANMWINSGEIPGNGVDDDSNGYIDDIYGIDAYNGDSDPIDDHGHGTHCSGTVGAVGDNGIGVVGVNWNVRIMALKFLSAGGSGPTDAAIECVEYATMMGAAVTSNSWGGGPYSAALEDAITDAYNAGILFVAAAGNYGDDNDLYPHYPSSYTVPGVVAVGATDHNDERVNVGYWASNYGLTSVDLGAPGLDIYSTMPGNNYEYKGGTSMATPHVSGTLALIKGRFPAITADAAKTLLLNSVDPIPALEGLWVTGGRLNAWKALSGPDSIPPDPVTDLTASATTSTAVLLQWTAAGDDGFEGTASAYDVRFASFPIDTLNFETATQAMGAPLPSPAGEPEQMLVTGLGFDTTYYFALKVMDEYGNTSPMSNVDMTTTPGPPTISVTPDSLYADLLTGEVQSQLLSITNSGVSDLSWQIQVQNVARDLPRLFTLQPPAPGDMYHDALVPEAKAAGVRPTPRQLPLTARLADLTDVALLWDRAHGQNPAEYYSTLVTDIVSRGATVTENFDPLDSGVLEDADILYLREGGGWSSGELAAIASWVQSGGALVLDGDEAISNFNDILTAMSAGITYSSSYASSGPTSNIFPHPTTEDVSEVFLDNPLASIAPVTYPAGELVADSAGVLCVAYSEVGTGRVVTLADEIFGDGNISMSDNQLFANQAIDWLAAGVDWLSAEPAAGTVPAGGAVDVSVLFDASALCGGDYQGTLLVLSNDPVIPEVVVAAAMHVTGEPDIAVSDTVIDYGGVFIGAVVTRIIEVSNPGCDLLSITDIASDHGDFTVTPTSFDLAVSQSQDVAVSFAPSSAAVIEGTLTIASNDPDEPTVTVALVGEGLIPPEIAVTPDSLAADLLTGEVQTQQLTVANNGGSDLVFDIRIEGASATLGVVGTDRGPSARMAEVRAAHSGPPVVSAESQVTPNQTDPTEGPVVLEGDYLGDHLHFGITDYGEIIPFQYPDGNEHLALGTWLSGYTVAYLVDGSDRVSYASYDARSGITPVSYVELVNTPTQVIVEVVTQTSDGVLEIVREITFQRDSKFLRTHTTIRNLSGSDVQNVVFKSFADWDVDGIFDNDWDYDFERNMAYAYLNHFVTIASQQVPDLMDLYGWDDYYRRETFVDFPVGPAYIDGVEILHYELGDLGPTGTTDITTAHAVGDDLAELQDVVDSAFTTWLYLDVYEGIVPAGGFQDLLVTFDAAAVCGGLYEADILIANNDPLAPEVRIPAQMHVTGEPDIAVSDTLLDYGAQFIGAVVTRTLVVSNPGCDLLSITEIAIDHSDFTATPMSFDLAVGAHQDVLVSFAPSSATVIEGTLTIASNDPDEPVVTVALRGEGLVAPEIVVTPDSLYADLLTGEVDSTQVVTIANKGGSDLHWTIELAGVTPGAATFTKADWADWSLPENQDRITDSVWITRANSQGIFNAATESGYNYLVSPEDTEWAYGLTEDLEPGDYQVWRDAVGGYPPGMVGQPISLHLISDDIYFDVLFHSWTAGGGGGGFSYTRTPVTPSWLEVSPVAGTVPAGGSMDVQVTFSAEELCGGDYLADMMILNNDPLAPAVRVATHMHVTGEPDIAVSDTLLDYGAQFIGAVVTQTLVVSNPGCDLLSVTEITTDHGDFTTTPTSFDLAVGESQDVLVSFAPSSAEVISGTLTIASNDPDEPVVTVALLGEGLVPPEIVVTPDSLSADLLTGETETQLVTIANNGGSDLIWEAFASFADTTVILEKSPVFGPREVAGDPKALATAPPARPAADLIYQSHVAMGEHKTERERVLPGKRDGDGEAATDGQVAAAADPSLLFTTGLEEVLENLNLNYPAVNGVIPNRFDFSDGVTGTNISDGGNDMYDGGNYLSTNLGGPLYYSDNLIVDSAIFGSAGRYFTRKYPGLFVLCADLEAVDYFEITGNLGADGSGFADGVVLETSMYGRTYQGFVKRVYDAWDPSVNHLIIIEGNPAVQHEFSTYTNDDYHRVFNLGESVRIYYLLYAGADGFYIDDTATLQIMNAFLGAIDLAPAWLTVEPEAGTVPPGGSVDVAVTFDATEICGGDYLADLLIANNDPLAPIVRVATYLHVTGEPDIAVSDTLLDYGAQFIGAVVTQTLVVSNPGCDLLSVTEITTDHGDFTAMPTSFDLAVGGSQEVLVSFAPSSAAVIEGTLTIVSNDPDEPVVTVTLMGEGLVPPEIVVTPDSLYAGLLPTQTATRIVSIANNGGSDLFWNIDVVNASISGSLLRTAAESALAGITCSARVERDGVSQPAFTPDELQEFQGRLAEYLQTVGAGDDDRDFPLIGVSGLDRYYMLTILLSNPELSSRYAFTDVDYGYEDLSDLDGLIIAPTDGEIILDRALALRAFYDSHRPIFLAMDDLDSNWNGAVPGLLGPVFGITAPQDGDFCALGTLNPDHPINEGIPEFVIGGGWCGDNDYYILAGADWVFKESTTDHIYGVAHQDLTRTVLMGENLTSIWFANEQLNVNAVIWMMEAASWLDVIPEAGTVPAGSSVDVEVTFTAPDECGGDYLADLLINSNDPLQPEVTVATHLHLIGEPGIAVSDTLLTYGPVYIGLTVVDSIQVTNIGCDTLRISEISSSHADFQVTPGSMDLAIDESRWVQVTFAPASVTVYDEVLSIASNDPTQPLVTLALTGEGLVPPEVDVRPDSLVADLITGEVVTRAVVIENTGGSDLTWWVETVPVDTAFAALARTPSEPLAAPGWRRLSGSDLAKTASSDPPPPGDPAVQTDPADLTGVDILRDEGHGQSYLIYWSTIRQDLLLRGANIQTTSNPIDADVLAEFEILWITDCYDNWTAAEIQAVSDWILAGGSLVLEGDSSTSVTAFNRFLTELGAGIAYLDTPGSGGITTNIYTHQTTLGVTSLFLQDNVNAQLASPMPPAGLLVEDVAGQPNAAFSQVVLGRVVTMADQLMMNTNVMYADNRLFANQVFDWLAGHVRWLRPDPDRGTVAAGDSVLVDVIFDARRLCTGDYLADLVFYTNDPDEAEVTVSTYLHVTGYPEIEVAPDPLVFGVYFVGTTVTDTFTVANPGCDELVVTEISSDHGDFSASPTSFNVPVGGYQPVVVTFNPSSIGTITGTLTITSNDPDESTYELSVEGTGVAAPVIAVDPTSLHEDLDMGESVTRTPLIQNLGGSDLTFSLALGLPDGFAAAATAGGSGGLASGAVTSLSLETSALASAADREVDALPARKQKAIPGSKVGVNPALGVSAAVYGGRDWQAQPTSDTVFFDDMESGVGDWTTEVFTGEDLWHHTHLLAYSPTTSWWCGVESQGNYDIGTRVNTSAISPVIDLRICQPPITLGFWENFNTEISIDRCMVDARVVPGGPWAELRMPLSGSSSGWVEESLDLSDFAGEMIQVRFHFDTLYSMNNNYLGWFFDDVRITAAVGPWLALDPIVGTVPPGGSVPVAVTFDATGLAAGDYLADIIVDTNDPVSPVVTVPASLTVSSVFMTVAIDAAIGTATDTGNVLGAAEDATDDYDPDYDQPEPPPSPPHYVSAYFSHPEWGAPVGERFQTDFRAPFDPLLEMRSWPLEVETDQSGTMTLAFAPSYDETSGWGLWLRDEATGQMYDLFPALTYSYSVGSAGTQTFTILVGRTIPPLEPPQRTLPAGWSLAGAPLVPPAGQDTWGDVLLDDAAGTTHLFSYDPAAGYVQVGAEAPVQQGQGLWVATTDSFTWTMEGTEDTDGITLAIHEGWTLVGYPLWTAGDLAGVLVDHAGTLLTYDEAVAAGLVAGSAFAYDNATGSYQAVTGLQTWHGYWFAGYASDLSLWFDFQNMLGRVTVAPGDDPNAPTSGDHWQVRVVMADSPSLIRFGMRAGATDGFDAAYDLPVPPLSPEDSSSPSLAFWRPEWNVSTGEKFMSDLIGPTDEPRLWEIRIDRPEPGTVTLYWDSGSIPEGRDFQLYLPAENRVVVLSMRDQATTQLEVGEESLAVQIRTPDFLTDVPAELAGLNLRNVPNPFNPSTEFRFNLPREGDVEIRVYNLRGALVRRLPGGVMPAGPAAIRWQGFDEHGARAASGTYFFRLFLDGRQEGPTLKMSMVK